MEITEKPRMIKIISGRPYDVEEEIAGLGNDYAVTHWHFCSDGPSVYVTAVLIHGSIIRQMQIASQAVNGGLRR